MYQSNSNPIAYSYIRFSTKDQMHGDSLARQLQAASEWCKKNSIALSDKNFRDLGISGYSGKTRPDLSAMLIAIENGHIKEGDYIILENLDRLSRQGIDKTQEIIRQILQKGVKIESLSDGISLNKSSLNDLISVIRIALSADLAHQESLKKSQRVQAAKNRQKQAALEGKVIKRRLPYWLKNDGDKYVFNENVGAIRLIISMRKQGQGYKSIAMALNKSEYKPRYGKIWSGTTVADILRHPALYGTYEFGTTVDGKFVVQGSVENYYPVLCSYSEFKSFQSNVAKTAGGITKHNHLYHLVRCQCGSAMSKKVSKRLVANQIKHYNQWVCVSSLSGGCDQTKPILDLDKLVFKAVNHLQVLDASSSDDANKIELEIANKENRVKELSAMLAMPDLSLSVVEIASAITKLKLDIANLKAQLGTHDTTDQDIQKLVDLIEHPEQFNMQLRRLVKHLVVYAISKNVWRVQVVQLNGHLVNVMASRSSERSPWRYFFGKTEQILELAKSSEFDDFSVDN
ncbi:MAG: recombinase family protein [Shewanella xiamenensis]